MNQCKSGLNEVNLAGGVNMCTVKTFPSSRFAIFVISSFSQGTKTLENVPAGALEFLAGNNNGCFCSRSETMNLQKREPDMNGHHTGKQTSSRGFKRPSFPRRIGSNTA